MNKKAYLLLIIVAALGLGLLIATQSKASARGFAGVVPFTTSGDRFGFFDQNSGKIYLYDSNISQCVFTGQLEDLGKPIHAIAIDTNAGSNADTNVGTNADTNTGTNAGTNVDTNGNTKNGSSANANAVAS